MIAPIDARATIDADGEKVELRLNFRTIALAAAAGVDLLSAGKIELDAFKMVKVITAFAVPAQPEFDQEQAFALVIGHGDACGKALSALLTSFAAAATGGLPGGDADPPKRRRTSPLAS